MHLAGKWNCSTDWTLPSITASSNTWAIANSSATTATGAYGAYQIVPWPADTGTVSYGGPPPLPDRFSLESGRQRTVELPDGSVLHLDRHGNYRFDDSEAKVVYRANRLREWNRYVSAGDTLEDFVRYAGRMGVRRQEFLSLPIELFMKFLILQAAEADGEPAPKDVVLALPAPKRIPKARCLACGRFVAKARAEALLPYCGRGHMLAYAERMALP